MLERLSPLMSQVFITGATGVLGRRLVDVLVDRGYRVYGLVRDETGAEIVRKRGGVARYADVLDVQSLRSATENIDIDAVIHAATAIPTSQKPTEDEWVLNDRVRYEGAENLVTVLGASVDWVLFPSVVWVARQPDGSPFDEDADRHPDRTTRSVAAVERYLESAGQENGFDVTVLRCGFLYAPDATHTRQWGRELLTGDLPIVGGGLLGRSDATLSFLHADDAARAFAVAIESDLTGIYHVVDDDRVTVAEFLSTFADYLDAPAPRRVPWWLARPLIGSELVTLLTTSMPTTNQTFKRHTGWKPTVPTYEHGLQHVCETWERDGTIQKTPEGYEWTANSC